MSRIIAYDLCRLFIGPYFATPRGIDRVDLAMASHIFADPDSPHLGILPTPLSVRAYPAHVVRPMLAHLERIWGESPASDQDPQLERLISDMQSPRVGTRENPRAGGAGLTVMDGVLRTLATLRHTGLRAGRAAERAVPDNAIYINMGQLALAVPSFFQWLKRRPDITCALMIHDTIPLDHPELVKAGSTAHHARMIMTAANHADCLIFSTAFARAKVDLAVAEAGQRQIPGLVRLLPVPAAFANAKESLVELAGKHYFVAISTVEPRKNFALLLQVWERLISEMGQDAPHLVMVGAPGLDAARILAPLAESPLLRQRVHHVSGLSSPALARLVAGCAALLSPSFAEGFGLPLLEGIALGVPTIASDIPSHREIAQDTTILLAADDEAGWRQAITDTPHVTSRNCPPLPVAMTEAAYCADIIAFIQSVGSKSGDASLGFDGMMR